MTTAMADPVIPPPSERDIEFTQGALERIALDKHSAGWGSFARVLHAVEQSLVAIRAECNEWKARYEHLANKDVT